MPIENPSWLNHQARCVDFTCNDSPGLDLYASLGKDNAVKAARNNDVIPFDLPLDPSLLAQDQAVCGDDVALDAGVQTERADEL